MWVQVKRFGILVSILGFVGAIKLAIQLWLLNKPLFRVYVKGINTPIYIRPNDSDIFVLMQTFWYASVDVTLDFPVEVIIDGGANIGLTTVLLANKYPDSKIIAVEPDRENCRVFNLNTAEYPRIQLIQGAIWDKESLVTITNPEADSWTLQVSEVEKDSIQNKVFGMTITHIMRVHGLDKVDLLKLDIEGSEKMVFEASDSLSLDKIGCILVETHDRFVVGSEAAVLKVAKQFGFKTSKSGEYLVLCRC